jgi:hypothetical protein
VISHLQVEQLMDDRLLSEFLRLLEKSGVEGEAGAW